MYSRGATWKPNAHAHDVIRVWQSCYGRLGMRLRNEGQAAKPAGTKLRTKQLGRNTLTGDLTHAAFFATEKQSTTRS